MAGVVRDRRVEMLLAHRHVVVRHGTVRAAPHGGPGSGARRARGHPAVRRSSAASPMSPRRRATPRPRLPTSLVRRASRRPRSTSISPTRRRSTSTSMRPSPTLWRPRSAPRLTARRTSPTGARVSATSDAPDSTSLASHPAFLVQAAVEPQVATAPAQHARRAAAERNAHFYVDLSEQIAVTTSEVAPIPRDVAYGGMAAVRAGTLPSMRLRSHLAGQPGADDQGRVGEERELGDLLTAHRQHEHAPRARVQVCAERRLAVRAGRA